MRWTFPLALTFLTICPWPRPALARPEELARSMFWFPWVGTILGLVFWAVHLALAQTLPPLPAAGLLLTVTVIVTRGLHLDGLADTLDGLGGGRTPESRLAIMKDSRLGAFGAMALVLVLVLKFAFFSALGAKGKEPMLILFPVLSRWGMVLLAAVSPYARSEGGLGQAMTEGGKPRHRGVRHLKFPGSDLHRLRDPRPAAPGGRWPAGPAVKPVFPPQIGRHNRRCAGGDQ
jgi:adenosylcobinamide-GDP ribazoletransferase